MKDVEVAYIAGLFDGEGDARVQSYRASKNRAAYDRLKVRITNTDKAALDWIRHVVGFGNVGTNYRNIVNRKDCRRY